MMNSEATQSAILRRLDMHVTDAEQLLAHHRADVLSEWAVDADATLLRRGQQLRGAIAFADSLLRDLDLLDDSNISENRCVILSRGRAAADEITQRVPYNV